MTIRGKSLALLAAIPSCMLLNAAEMQPRPEVPVWVSDGVTEYRLFIWVYNSGLSGEVTRGVEWGLMSTVGFSYVPYSSAAPVTEDFFAGFPTMDSFLLPTEISDRFVMEHGPGPIDSQGNVGEYRFTVPPETAPGVYTIDLDWRCNMYSPNWTQQDCTLVSGSVRVVASHIAGIASCMNGPAALYPDGLACDYYDFDGDGDVDLADWSAYQLSYPSLPG